MKIVIPMAGRGSRFTEQGWTTPKPLIEVAGRPMLLWALESLRGLPLSELIFLVLREHEEQYQISRLLKEHLTYACRFIILNEVTDGQLCTVLEAETLIDGEEDVLIMASDSLVISPDLPEEIRRARDAGLAGLISVANLPGDRWSFARTDTAGRVVEVAEKVRISDHASTGLYYFSLGAELVKTGRKMIQNQEKTRGEYYVIPVYQKLIDQGRQVGISRASEMWDMGTPEAKELFEKNLSKIKKLTE